MGLLDSFLSGIDNFKRKTAKNIWDAVTNPSDFANMTAARMQEDRYGGPEEAYAMKQYLSQQPYDKEALKRANEALAMNAVNESLGAVTVWHGSPHKFNKFDMSKIGTGEGAQAYGHGLYMAEAQDVADEYAKKLGNANASLYLDGKPYTYDMYQSLSDADRLIAQEFDGLPKNWRTKNELLDSLKSRSKGAFKNWKPTFKEAIEKVKSDAVSLDTPQNLYKVDIPDEAVARMLDWDAPKHMQPKSIMDIPIMAEESMWMPDGKINSHLAGMPKFAEILKENGIPGIRYLDGGSRSAGQGSSNYVLFDDQMPRILEINGQPTGLQPWQQGEWQGLLGR